MAPGIVLGPHIGKPEDQSWRPSLASDRVRLKAARDSIDAKTLPAEWRANKTDMLESLTRIISDRTAGQTFFGDAALMDYELIGGDARDTIVAETKARGMTAHLPSRVPFGSHRWPTLVTAWPGPASLADLH